MKNTFEQLYKEKIKNTIQSYFSDYSVKAVNDLAQAKDQDGKTIFIIVNHTSGNRQTTTTNEVIDSQILMNFYVPYNEKDECMRVLHYYAENESGLEDSQVLTETETIEGVETEVAAYYFYHNLGTPTTNNLTLTLGAKYIQVILSGRVVYSDSQMATSNEDYYISVPNNGTYGEFTKLNNVIDVTEQVTPYADQKMVEGMLYPTQDIIRIDKTISITLVYDKNDTTHQWLNDYVLNGQMAKDTIQVKVGATSGGTTTYSPSYKYLLSITANKKKTTFPVFTLTLIRKGE